MPCEAKHKGMKTAESSRDDQGEAKAALYTAKALGYETKLLGAVQTQFNMQRDEILRSLQTTQRGIRTKDYVSSLIDWDSADDAMKAAVEPYLLEVLLEAGRDAMLAIGLDPGVYDPYEETIREWLTSRSTRIAVDVNDETEKQIRASLSEGLNAGEGNTALAARVEAVMGLAATMRADLIAQTEVARAQSQADVFAWTQSGVVDGKEWFTAEDEKVCKFCGPMNGRVISLDGNFFTQGDVQIEDGENRKGEKITSKLNHDYDDVVGPPLHPRCRCTLLPVRSAK